MHSTCWAHIIHLAAEEIRGKFKTADKYIAAMKSALSKSPSRRSEYLDVMEVHARPRKLPPKPVITRWCTWIQAGKFHFDNFTQEVEWIASTSEDAVSISKLKKLACKVNLPLELRKIAELEEAFCTSLRQMERRSLPASEVWLILKTLQGVCEEVLDEESLKLKLYMEGRHPSFQFWRDVQFLDPRKASQFAESAGSEILPATLARFGSANPSRVELIKYREIRSGLTYDHQFSVFAFWKTFTSELPVLSNLALCALSIPASSSFVERSFSELRRLLTPLRSNLTEVNLGIHLRVSFNGKNADKSSVVNGEDE